MCAFFGVPVLCARIQRFPGPRIFMLTQALASLPHHRQTRCMLHSKMAVCYPAFSIAVAELMRFNTIVFLSLFNFRAALDAKPVLWSFE